MNTSDPLSLYIHIPFCTLKCSYCDFNSYAGIEALMRPFVDALCDEMRLWGGALAQGWGSEPQRRRRRVETVFFGGGTPSLLPLEEVERIMTVMRESLTPRPPLPCAGEGEQEIEVSFEANPGTVDRDYLCGLLAAGVNRISFGVQSFHDDELAALDRIHSAEEAKEAYRWAREAGFERINLDLIYGLSDPRCPLIPSIPQDERDGALEDCMERWQFTLEQALELGPEHLSLYALTVEEGTKLAHDIERGRVPGPDGDAQAAMYEWSCDRLASAGYRQYEISNWCRPGPSAPPVGGLRTGEECRHNLVYWRNGEWLGLGPGAHSHLGGKMEDGGWKMGYRFADVYSPKRYIELVRETVERSAISGQQSAVSNLASVVCDMRQVAFVEEQTVEMGMADTAILGLRLNEGLDVSEFVRRFGRTLEEVYGPVLAETVSFGLIERENGRVRLTERGRFLANEVFMRLLPD